MGGARCPATVGHAGILVMSDLVGRLLGRRGWERPPASSSSGAVRLEPTEGPARALGHEVRRDVQGNRLNVASNGAIHSPYETVANR
jgi:hypothetical protein